MSEPSQTEIQATAANDAGAGGFAAWLGARFKGSGGKRRPLRVRLKEWFGLGRLIGLALLLVLGVIRAIDPAPIESMRVTAFDFYQTLKPREATQGLVTIVDIDENSLAELGQWPWPRTFLAQIVQNLTQMGALVVGFDVFFTEPDRMSPDLYVQSVPNLEPEVASSLNKMPSNDRVFALAVKRGRVVMGQSGFHRVIEGGAEPPKPTPVAIKKSRGGLDPKDILFAYASIVGNIPILEQAAAGLGMVTLKPEEVVRRVPAVVRVGKGLYPSLVIEMLRVGTNNKAYAINSNIGGITNIVIPKSNMLPKAWNIPTDPNGRIYVYFRHHDPNLYVPAKDVFNGTVDPARIQGKFVLIGTSAAGLLDIRSTPLDAAIPGVEVHANMLDTIFTDSSLHRRTDAMGIELSGALIAGLLMIVLVPIVGVWWTLGLLVVLLGGLGGGSWYLFDQELTLVDVTYPGFSTLAMWATLTVTSFSAEAAQKRQVRSAFGHYLSPALVEQLADNPEQLHLGGEMKDMTLLFADIRGFTTISEQFKSDPEGLTALINRFLTPMTNMILSRRGTIDNYMGDCIMAFWNTPLDDDDHARNACTSALAMFEALEPLNEEIKIEREAVGEPFYPIIIGIGLNSGECCVGNMGSDMRFDYSVLGDTVNLAARLEGQSKNYGVGIVIGETTRDAVPDFASLELDLIAVKGKTEAVRIFALFGDPEMKASERFQGLAEHNAAMLEAYRSQNWAAAREAIGRCRNVDGAVEGLYQLYEERIEAYEQEPPDADWDGVFVATSK